MAKTNEEIEKLKKTWSEDPRWDIEQTEGFEEHVAELLEFRQSMESEWAVKAMKKVAERAKRVLASTGIDDMDLAKYIRTFEEIENAAQRSLTSEYSMLDIAVAQVRATLLQAAELKRIGDLLKDISDNGLHVDAVTSDKYTI